jgi:hypothetical protein
VICYYLWDLDRAVEKRRGRSSLERHLRRGPGALEIIGEVVPVVLDGDGVLDGLQEVAASPRGWSTILRASCIDGKGRLEIRPRPCHAEHGGVRRAETDLGREVHTG